jgi:phosphocarrier protein
MTQAEVVIQNDPGLHARPAAIFVKEATRFRSDIFVLKNGQRVNGKSILGVIMLAAETGARLTIQAHGPDEREAVEALASLINRRFGIEE